MLGTVGINNQSLKTFLEYDFSAPVESTKNVLAVSREEWNNIEISRLRQINLATVNPLKKAWVWLNGDASLPNICKVIRDNWPFWSKEKLTAAQMQRLEEQSAWLERKVRHYNERNDRQPEDHIRFSNPFKGTLHVTLKYPRDADNPSQFYEKSFELNYDRVLLNQGAVGNFIHSLKTSPLPVVVKAREAHDKDQKDYLFEVIPENYFKRCIQWEDQGSEIDEKGRYHFPDHKYIKIQFSDPDPLTLVHSIVETTKQFVTDQAYRKGYNEGFNGIPPAF